MNEETTAVAVREQGAGALEIGLRLDSYQAMKDISADFAKSGIFGEISQSQGLVSLCAMRDEGLSVSSFRRKYQWVGSELSTRPNWMLGEFKRRGGKVHIMQADAEACEIEFTHWDGESLKMRITMEQMKATDIPWDKSHNLKKNWKNFPDDMLFARVCGKALRRLAPEVFAGVYTDGEAQDFEGAPAQKRTIKLSKDEVVSRVKEQEKTVHDSQEDTDDEEDGFVDAVDEAEAVEPVVVDESPAPTSATASEPAHAITAFDMTVPVAGEFFGWTFGRMANERPDLIMALLKCNRSKHPELTNEHIDALEEIASIMNQEAGHAE